MIRKILTLLILLATTVAVFGQQTQPASVNAADCGCGNYSIKSELDMVKAGESVDFELSSKDQDISGNQYSWTVSAGQIVSGHGTSKIKVQTFEGMESAVTPRPTPKPDSMIGLIWRSGPERTWPTIEVSVAIISKTCNCTLKSKDVAVGLRTMVRNVPADVTDLSLSSDRLVHKCPPGQATLDELPQPSESMIIDVKTRVFDTENDVLAYNYTVSTGEIVGTGSKVKWDLSEAPPGTHTITAGVDDGCGICGKTLTKTVTVGECITTWTLPDCPLVEIRSAKNLGSFEEILFNAKILGGDGLDLIWSVENGELIDGQGTPQIRVKTGSISASNAFSISLKLSGFHQFSNCRETSTVTYESKNGQFVKNSEPTSPK